MSFVNPYAFAAAPVGDATAWSPNVKMSNITLTNGNRTAQVATAPYMVGSRDAKTTGKYYFEITYDNTGVDNSAHLIGVMTATGAGNTAPQLSMEGITQPNKTYGTFYKASDGTIKSAAGGSASATLDTIDTAGLGDIIGVHVNLDDGEVRFRVNGGAQSDAIAITTGQAYFPAIGLANNSNTLTANFGNAAWDTAPDSGYGAWTENDDYEGRYYRIYKVLGADPNLFGIVEAELRLTTGGADQTGSGTASAWNEFSPPTYSADKAVDNNTSTLWSDTYGAGAERWWQYDLGSAAAIIEATLQKRSDTTLDAASRLWIVRSNDNLVWFPCIWQDNLSWTSGETKTFNWE